MKTNDEIKKFLRFQFQYGTIKSIHLNRAIYNYYPFQFQYGTIKSKSLVPDSISTLAFQFQYGTIKRFPNLHCLHISQSISIPVWYD